MAGKSKAALETELRNDVLETIRAALGEHYDTDVLDVSASEIAIPLVDSESNEKFAVIKVSIPRGTRVDGGYVPYDGYEAAKEYARDLADKENEKKAREEKKVREEKEKERKRAAKQTIKTMKSDIQEIFGTDNAATES